MPKPYSSALRYACAGLALLVTACVAPPPGPPIVLRPVVASAPRPRVRPPEPCETPAQARLSDSQKASLFQDFDAWQQERRPSGAPAATAVPPPGPVQKVNTPGRNGCRVTSPRR